MDDKQIADIESRLWQSVRALVAEIRALSAPAWMDGLPPADVFVWREGSSSHRPVRTSNRAGALSFISAHDPGGWQPWGTPRWAPIPDPSASVQAPPSPAEKLNSALDDMSVYEIEAYLSRRRRAAWLAQGRGDGFERLSEEKRLHVLCLHEGCWVWRDPNGLIRRAFGTIGSPHWPDQDVWWVTVDSQSEEIVWGRLRDVPTSVPLQQRVLSNSQWLAQIRVWLLTQPIEGTW